MKVEELSQYGKTLSGLPREAIKKQRTVVLRAMRKKFGLLGILPFFVKLVFHQKALKKNYPEAYQKAAQISEGAAKEITMLVAMFNIVAKKEGTENAYNFLKEIF
jgi:hypothetical protein